MRGLTFSGNRRVDFIDVPDPVPGPGEVVIEIKASGLCGSDLHYYRSETGSGGPVAAAQAADPVIAGHEPCGIVAEIGPGVSPAEAAMGQRVMVHHYWGCGACGDCRSGWPQMCAETTPAIYGVNAHGGHAPYLRVPARTLVPLPEGLSFTTGAALACGTGTAFHALRRLDLNGRDRIAIFGQGPVGLAATQLAVAQGAEVIAVDVDRSRIDHARRLGAMHAISPEEDDPVAVIRDLTDGGAELAMDTSGLASAREQAAQAVRRWGRVGLVGAGGRLDIAIADILRKQVELVASWTFSSPGLAECAAFIARCGIDADAVFTHRWSLDEGEEAYCRFDRRETGKAVFEL